METSMATSWIFILGIFGVVAVVCIAIAIVIAAVGSAKRKSPRNDD